MVAKKEFAWSSVASGAGRRGYCCRSSRFCNEIRFGHAIGIALPMEDGSQASRHASMKRRSAIISGQQVEITWEEKPDRIIATVSGRTYDLQKRELGPGKYWFGGDDLSFEA